MYKQLLFWFHMAICLSVTHTPYIFVPLSTWWKKELKHNSTIAWAMAPPMQANIRKSMFTTHLPLNATHTNPIQPAIALRRVRFDLPFSRTSITPNPIVHQLSFVYCFLLFNLVLSPLSFRPSLRAPPSTYTYTHTHPIRGWTWWMTKPRASPPSCVDDEARI